jgi:nucleoside-diphosphate-sugar epimerase
MGSEAFKELLRRKDNYDIVVILRPSKKNKDMFAKWETEPGVRIVWGDLCELKDVREAMKGVEHVLHPAAFISPEADMNPVQAKRLNHGGMLNHPRPACNSSNHAIILALKFYPYLDTCIKPKRFTCPSA